MSSIFQKKSFICLGDFCLSGDQTEQFLKVQEINPFAESCKLFGDDVAAIANLECPFTDQTQGLPYKWANLKASPELHWVLDGLSMAVLGNNHISDFGDQGAKDTENLLKSKGIESVGYGDTMTEAMKPAFLTLGDQRLGVVSLCCPTTNGENLATHLTPGVVPLGMQTIKQAVERAKDQCDALLVYLHWGCEWVHDPAPDQLRLARYAIDCGADAVVGCHSHTIQSYEQYKGRWIFYGLGNYLFRAGFGQQVLADGSIKQIPLKLDPPNRESIAVQFSITSDQGEGRLALESVQAMRFEDDLIPRVITLEELTFDLKACNARLCEYVNLHQNTLSDRNEPVFRAKLLNGSAIAYWYSKESILIDESKIQRIKNKVIRYTKRFLLKVFPTKVINFLRRLKLHLKYI